MGDRNEIPVISQKTGADAASVVYDAYQSAVAKNIDILLQIQQDDSIPKKPNARVGKN